MMCDARLWAPQRDCLQACCSSVTVADTTRHDSIAAIARHILAEAPDRFAVAGLSMGGFVVFELWRQAAARITHLALLDTNDHADMTERAEQRQQLLAQAIAGGLQAVVAEALKPVYLAAGHQHEKAVLHTIMDMALSLGVEVFERQCKAIRNRRESRSLLAEITVPALVLCGVEDKLCPPDVHKAMAAHIANSQLVLVERCGHLSSLEQPEIVNAAMQAWLNLA